MATILAVTLAVKQVELGVAVVTSRHISFRRVGRLYLSVSRRIRIHPGQAST